MPLQQAIIQQIRNNSITTLDLSNEGIGDDGAKELAEALKVNQSITNLNLSRNKIGEAGAKYLAEALKTNQSITDLNLFDNNIGEVGAHYLAEALKINQFITALYLYGNKIGEVGAKDIAEALKINKSITNLSLYYNQIGDAGAKDLAETLKINHSITTLDLTGNQIGAAGLQTLAEVLKVNQSITNLNLDYNQIGDAGAKDLAETLKINHSITTLDLYYNKIGDAEVQTLAEALKINHSITTLNLGYHNRIGDDGVQALAEGLTINQSITTLNLDYNQIGNAGVQTLAEALKINNSITDLKLNNNNIGDTGARYLSEALKINKSITTLHLEWSQIGDDGMKELVEALRINHSITTLKLYGNHHHIREKDIAEALKINKELPEKVRQEAERVKQQQQAEAAEQARQEALVKQYIAEQVRQQEAERLEQEANLKEQEEAKAAKEAAKLKALEEAKVKEYIPDIPVVKLFEVAGGDNQFNNDDQATIKEVSNLIREGNDRLQEHGKKGILLLGNTGAGKSTLAHLFSGKKLQAIFDNETAELVIDAMQPLDDIVIGHKSASETKIPNKCLAKDLIIWDCPGFNDTDPVQEIANSFYIKRLFETTKQLKFVLVVPESVLNIAIERGNIFLAALSNFIKSFKDIKSIEGSISLVVTHVPPNKNIHHIKKSIDKILTDNQGATDEHKDLINKLKSIHLFHRPDKEGELTVPDLLAAIDESSKYSNAKGDMVNIAISQKAKDCSSHLLNTASNNFNQLLELIVKAIADATQCLNVNPLNAFSENYVIVKDWVPSSIHYNELKKHSEGEYFLKLELLSRLQKLLNCEQKSSISDAITIFKQAVDIFAEYAESDNSPLQHQIQDYGYCLRQQYEYVKFFANVCGVELPDHVKIPELITTCHTNVTKNLEYQVSNLPIDENQSDPDYYTKAIEYLEKYKDSPACKTLKAIAYSCKASIYEQNGAKESPLVYYVKAIEADSHLPKIYEKLGQLFFNKGEYAKAIDCYKVVNNEFRIKACFKAWLKQDEENPDIMLKQAEYFESIGLFEKAKTCYQHVFSLSEDNTVKAAAYKKIGNIMVNAATQGQDFITKAEEQDFYNYDLVDRTFIDSLLVGEVDDSRCDLYC